MKSGCFGYCLAFVFFMIFSQGIAQKADDFSSTYAQLKKDFLNPPPAADPWVFWYWMQAAVSREGITADLEAMKQVGIRGAYLMPIKGVANPPIYQPVSEQLTPEWWGMVKFALGEADRLGLKIAMHISDGFALAGGPWITPEMSMQKLVSSSLAIKGGQKFNDTLPRPLSNEGYYKDIAVYAYPVKPGHARSTLQDVPIVTTSKTGVDANGLANPSSQSSFKSDDSCWIQYAFEKPFTCRSIFIKSDGRNYFANRLWISVSDDGKTFREITRLEAPRHGWQDNDAGVTHSIAPVTAKYFRFAYSKSGVEPGAEDLDAAKWKPSLSIRYLELSGASKVHQFEGKTGEVWRISKRTTNAQVQEADCVPLNTCIDITKYMAASGRLEWNAPAGDWMIVRIGHTSTGHRNETGGGGKGLECDKFNTAAIESQFDHWFGEALKQAGPQLAPRVLNIMHIDSWECGSQNWSSNFAQEFQRRRGYSMMPYLPVMTGVPMVSASFSEQFLFDVRQTISELVVDIFYKTFARLAREKGCIFSAESVAPTMMSDGLAHYKEVDLPMGEFWLGSPTHDKPNDMMDAISGAHVYGKRVIQAEAFTEVRMAWNESPVMLKALGDRNYALGINRFVYHVFSHNPWKDRKPGMTLGDGVGLFFQRDQTWFKQGKAWVDYARRCQALLQPGAPVNDVAVFTGEELPRRSVLPDRLVPVLPGLFGNERVHSEETRLLNTNQPLRQKPAGVTHSANMADPENWTDPLKGYGYDSFNPDVLLHGSSVKAGAVQFRGVVPYKLIVIPGVTKMSPQKGLMSGAVAKKLLTLVKDGATVLLQEAPAVEPGYRPNSANDASFKELWQPFSSSAMPYRKLGKGRVIQGSWMGATLESLGIERDLIASENGKNQAPAIAWTHRQGNDYDIYFLSNQEERPRELEISLRSSKGSPELWDAVNGTIASAEKWSIQNKRTVLPIKLPSNGSIFIILSPAVKAPLKQPASASIKSLDITDDWNLKFDSSLGGPSQVINVAKLSDWSKDSLSSIRYYSGTVIYSKNFRFNQPVNHSKVLLELGEVHDIATVTLNGIECGTAWTFPFSIDVSKALKQGENQLEIAVTNTWANRMIGDHSNTGKVITSTTATYRLEGKPLLPAGLLGPVKISSGN